MSFGCNKEVKSIYNIEKYCKFSKVHIYERVSIPEGMSALLYNIVYDSKMKKLEEIPEHAYTFVKNKCPLGVAEKDRIKYR